MNTTYKSLKKESPRLSWQEQQAAALLAHKKDRNSRISPASAKELADRESAEKMESMQLFSDSDLAELAAQMQETPKLQINKTEYVRILHGGALESPYMEY